MRKWSQQLLTIEPVFHYSNIWLIISSRNAGSMASCNSTPKQARTSLAARALQHVFITHLTWRTAASAQSSRNPRKPLASSSCSSDDQANFDVGGVGDLGSPIDAPNTGRELTVALTRSSGSESVSASDAIETGLARTPYPQNSGSALPSSFRELASGSVAPSASGDAGESIIGFGNSQSARGDVMTSMSIGDDTTNGMKKCLSVSEAVADMSNGSYCVSVSC